MTSLIKRSVIIMLRTIKSNPTSPSSKTEPKTLWPCSNTSHVPAAFSLPPNIEQPSHYIIRNYERIIIIRRSSNGGQGNKLRPVAERDCRLQGSRIVFRNSIIPDKISSASATWPRNAWGAVGDGRSCRNRRNLRPWRTCGPSGPK